MALHTGGAAESGGQSSQRGDWRRGLPALSDGTVTLRELTTRDAMSLVAHLNTPAVKRHLATPPASADGFRRFIRWTRAQRRRGFLACFGVVPCGTKAPVGLVQLWRVESDFATAEWGIALGETWWGRGVGQAAARLLFEFAFETLNAGRLEARTVASNERGHALMTRLGATREGTLRHSFRRGHATESQELWAIFAASLDRD